MVDVSKNNSISGIINLIVFVDIIRKKGKREENRNKGCAKKNSLKKMKKYIKGNPERSICPRTQRPLVTIIFAFLIIALKPEICSKNSKSIMILLLLKVFSDSYSGKIIRIFLQEGIVKGFLVKILLKNKCVLK